MYESKKIDVLVCVGHKDVDFLLKYCLDSCIRHFRLLNNIYIVSDVPEKVRLLIREHINYQENIVIIHDNDVLDKEYLSLNSWYRQQIIKLKANSICKTKYICCLGADTVILKDINYVDLFYKDNQIIYFNRYKKSEIHLTYERKRVGNVSKILKVTPFRSYLLGDFIMDLMIFDSDILKQLNDYLIRLYGTFPFLQIINNNASNFLEKSTFGEWTLYSVFVIDHLNKKFRVRNSSSHFLTQLHTSRDLVSFNFDSYIVHFVDKNFDKSYIVNKLSLLLYQNGEKSTGAAHHKHYKLFVSKKFRLKKCLINESCGFFYVKYYINAKKFSLIARLYSHMDYIKFWLPQMLFIQKFSTSDVCRIFNVSKYDACHLICELKKEKLIY
jgi:hypothetical protein